MKSNKNKKKKLLAAASALALVAAMAGTFAWITQRDERINRVESAKVVDGTVTIDEIWQPGDLGADTTMVKQVTVKNTGKSKVFVRASFEEVLQYLASKGVETSSATPASGTDIAVEFDAAKYTDSGSGYTDITSKVTGVPATVKVYAQGATTISSDGTVKANVEIVAWNEVGGKAQKITHDIKLVAGQTITAGQTATDWNYEATAVAYSVYAGGFTHQAVNWATSSVDSSGAAVLGTAGVKYGVSYDYTTGTIGALPAVTKLALADAPTAANQQKAVQAAKAAFGATTNAIHINYGADMIDPSGSLSADKWVYNEDDGWFYYTSPLVGGVTSKNLMESLYFDGSVDEKFTLATYDLIVKMEAIQTSEEALTDSAGWNLGTSGTSGKIVAQLTQ